MGLLSDPNRRRALINLLTRLNTPIWSVHSCVEIDTVDSEMLHDVTSVCHLVLPLKRAGMARVCTKVCDVCVCVCVVLSASWQVWPGSWV